MHSFKLLFTRALIAFIIFAGMAVPVFAQGADETLSPSAIIIQQINTRPGTIEWVILAQITLFLILLTLILNGTVQQKLKLKLQRITPSRFKR